MSKYHPVISDVVQWVVRHWPITEGKKQIIRWLQSYLIPDNNHIVVSSMKAGFKLKLNLNNKEHIHIYLYGEHDERYETSFVKKIILPSDQIWDIGANIGFYSMLFSRLAFDGHVFSFEPVKGTRDFLQSQVKINDASNITILDFALGNQDGALNIFFNDPTAAEGTASIHGVDKPCHELIKIKKIDDIAGNLPTPNFVKIDVEGHQNHLLRGGLTFFKENAPIVMAELCDSDETMAETQELLFELGYDIFEIKKRGVLVAVKHLKASRSRNFVLCKKGSPGWKRISTLICCKSSP